VHSNTDGVTCVLHSRSTAETASFCSSILACLAAGTKMRGVSWALRTSPTTRLNLFAFLTETSQSHGPPYKGPYITCTTAPLNICSNLQWFSANCHPSVDGPEICSHWKHMKVISTDRDHSSVTENLDILLLRIFCPQLPAFHSASCLL
jgi:hypothetical protein